MTRCKAVLDKISLKGEGKMNGFIILLIAIVVFVAAYATYGAWLCKKWGIDPHRKTPAVEVNDGDDYVPTSPAVLLGHHFASIAGAGPITGPIQAAFFGWIPVRSSACHTYLKVSCRSKPVSAWLCRYRLSRIISSRIACASCSSIVFMITPHPSPCLTSFTRGLPAK